MMAVNREDQLADLLVRWDDAIESGRPVTPDELCGNTPDLKAEFTELLRKLGKVDPVLEGHVVATPVDNGDIDAGRYVPLSFHAKGGLGLVYVAEDKELRRTVALKWMQNLPAMDERARRRFVNEAEITGKLEHPGVAPVYGAGKDPHGRPYYAMRFIQGRTLADEIQYFHFNFKHQFRSGEFSKLLRKFVTVCQTIAYAHARGVIHRDIKPGNIMIGPYGETLVVDWGLAKTYTLPDPDGTFDTGFLPVKIELDAGENSLEGQIKGSPSFMSPEQARAENDRVGPATDIYALGATLYLVLTGKSFYAGKKVEEILHELKQRGPSFNPDNEPIPKALLEIVRKAMAREPGDRYATALLLADDLDRWLADEPVSVYRDGLLTRGRRWVKRNRTLVAASTAMAFIVILAMVVVIPILSQKTRELTKITDDLRQTNQQLGVEINAKNEANQQLEKRNNELLASYSEIETGYEDAVMSMGFMFSKLAFASSAAGGIDRSLIIESIAPYETMLKRYITANAGKRQFRESVAMGLLKLAEVQMLREERIEALKSMKQASDAFDGILKEDPGNRNARYGRAICEQVFVEEDLNSEKYAQAIPRLEKVRDEYEKLARDPTPLKLTQFTSSATGDVYQDSPGVRLGKVTLNLIYVINTYERLSAKDQGKPISGDLNPKYRTWLITALDLINGGKPLPQNAASMTLELALRIENVLLLDPKWEGNTPARREQFRKRLDDMLTNHGYLPNLHNISMQQKRFQASEAVRRGDRAQAIRLMEEIVATGKKIIDTWSQYDPLGIRDGATGTFLSSCEELLILYRENLFAEALSPKPDPKKTEALGKNLERVGGYMLDSLKYLSERPPRGVRETLEASQTGFRIAQILMLMDDPEAIKECIQILTWTSKIIQNQINVKAEHAKFDLKLFDTHCRLMIALAKNLIDQPDRILESVVIMEIDDLLKGKQNDPKLIYLKSKTFVFAGIQCLRSGQFAKAIEHYDLVIAKLNESESLGFSPLDCEFDRLAYRMTIAGSYLEYAKQLRAKNPKSPEAVVQLNKAKEICRSIKDHDSKWIKTEEDRAKLHQIKLAVSEIQKEVEALENK